VTDPRSIQATNRASCSDGLAVITEREPVQRILAHLGVPTEAPPTARARDPTDDDADEVESRPEQLPGTMLASKACKISLPRLSR
jgi:hypothetical protein